MKHFSHLALGAALIAGLPLVASAADSMKNGPMQRKLTVAAAFDPAPPKKGMENRRRERRCGQAG